jgi:hypothetical protein
MFDTIFRHAVGIRGNTERYVCGSWPVKVLGGGAKLL